MKAKALVDSLIDTLAEKQAEAPIERHVKVKP